MGVVLETGLPDVAGLRGGARRPRGTDTFITEILIVELRDRDPPASVQVVRVIADAHLAWRRRCGRPGLPFSTHLGLVDATGPRPRPSQRDSTRGKVKCYPQQVKL